MHPGSDPERDRQVRLGSLSEVSLPWLRVAPDSERG